MVEAEQLLEDVGLLLPGLQVGDDLELAVEERLVAPGQVDEQPGHGLLAVSLGVGELGGQPMLRACCSSVFLQKTMTPAEAARTATPWMIAHVHGRSWPESWLKMSVSAMALPPAWEATVNSTFHRNGTQSW